MRRTLSSLFRSSGCVRCSCRQLSHVKRFNQTERRILHRCYMHRVASCSTVAETRTSSIVGLKSRQTSVGTRRPTGPAQSTQSFAANLHVLQETLGRICRIDMIDVVRTLDALTERDNITVEMGCFLVSCCGRQLPQADGNLKAQLANRIRNILSARGILCIEHYNCLLQTYLENEFDFSVAEFLQRIRSKNCQPNQQTFELLMSKCADACDTKTMRDAAAVEQLVESMKTFGIVPSKEYHLRVALGYAAIGDFQNLEKSLAEVDLAKSKASTSLEDYLRVATCLAKHGYTDYAFRVTERIAASIRLDNYHRCLSEAFRFASLGYWDLGFALVRCLRVPAQPSDGQRNSTLHLLCFFEELLRLNVPTLKLIAYCKALQNDGVPNVLEQLIGRELSKLNTGKAAFLLQLCQQSGVALKQEHFTPLVLQFASQNNLDGVVSTLGWMHNAAVPIDAPFIRGWILSVNPEITLARLRRQTTALDHIEEFNGKIPSADVFVDNWSVEPVPSTRSSLVQQQNGGNASELYSSPDSIRPENRLMDGQRTLVDPNGSYSSVPSQLMGRTADTPSRNSDIGARIYSARDVMRHMHLVHSPQNSGVQVLHTDRRINAPIPQIPSDHELVRSFETFLNEGKNKDAINLVVHRIRSKYTRQTFHLINKCCEVLLTKKDLESLRLFSSFLPAHFVTTTKVLINIMELELERNNFGGVLDLLRTCLHNREIRRCDNVLRRLCHQADEFVNQLHTILSEASSTGTLYHAMHVWTEHMVSSQFAFADTLHRMIPFVSKLISDDIQTLKVSRYARRRRNVECLWRYLPLLSEENQKSRLVVYEYIARIYSDEKKHLDAVRAIQLALNAGLKREDFPAGLLIELEVHAKRTYQAETAKTVDATAMPKLVLFSPLGSSNFSAPRRGLRRQDKAAVPSVPKAKPGNLLADLPFRKTPINIEYEEQVAVFRIAAEVQRQALCALSF